MLLAAVHELVQPLPLLLRLLLILPVRLKVVHFLKNICMLQKES